MSTRSKWARIVFAAVTTTVLAGGSAFPQQTATDEGKRKVKTRVNPVYPELARRLNVSGKVKIEVVITPDGHVRSSHVIGGHPLLVQACREAVKEWKFYPAPDETTQIIECDFQGAN